MSGLIAVGYFLISLVFDLMIFCFWIRISLRYLRVSSLNQFSTLIYRLTDPFVNPLHLLFKKYYQPIRTYDWMAFLVLIVLECFKVTCLSLIVFFKAFNIPLMLIYVFADLIIQPCTILFYAILIRVVMSYVNPGWQHPAADFLRLITEPMLRLGRKIIPNISGFDFSPIVAIIILKMISLFITASLPLRLF